MKPSIGRIVWYYATDEDRKRIIFNGPIGSSVGKTGIIPAIITSVNDDYKKVNLKLIVDGDMPGVWVRDVPESDNEIFTLGTWMWPPREIEAEKPRAKVTHPLIICETLLKAETDITVALSAIDSLPIFTGELRDAANILKAARIIVQNVRADTN